MILGPTIEGNQVILSSAVKVPRLLFPFQLTVALQVDLLSIFNIFSKPTPVQTFAYIYLNYHFITDHPIIYLPSGLLISPLVTRIFFGKWLLMSKMFHQVQNTSTIDV